MADRPCHSTAGNPMRSAEIFAGCGVLALGLSRAGFAPVLMAEWDEDAVATVLHNRARSVEHVSEWPMKQQDVREIDWAALAGTLDATSGGPPCQPFAIGGKKGGHEDPRDMWPEAIRAVREGRPRGFLFENVRNLAGPRFSGYLGWILESLRRPDEPRKRGEDRDAHLARLRKSKRPAAYGVACQVVNAADYGASQIRFRVVIFGIRLDVGAAPIAMTPTHSRDRLLWDQWVTGDYWKRHGLMAPAAGPTRRDAARVRHLRGMLVSPPGLPWVTLRDALAGLGQPNGRRNHVFRDGARIYAGHTGSELDMPAKALKAGDHGVPGGENMIRFADGTVRYLTSREAARLVGLPDDFEFPRSWTESMRQMGNAVPAQLAEAAGRHLALMLEPSERVLAAAAT
jgi:DNA (cytosine-5)-methyltransferase 1